MIKMIKTADDKHFITGMISRKQ